MTRSKGTRKLGIFERRDRDEDKKLFLEAVILAQEAGNPLVGQLSIARHVNSVTEFKLPMAKDDLGRTRAYLSRLAPEVVELSMEVMPGNVMIVRNDGTYLLKSELDADDMASIIRRMRTALSKEHRVEMELSVGKTPGQKALRTYVADRNRSAETMLGIFTELIEKEQESAA